MDFSIKRLEAGDARELLDFELENREWFDRWVPPRPDGYFTFAGIRSAIEGLLVEQKRGECALFLVRDHEGRIAGRINLTGIDPEVRDTAELGYRVGAAFTGRGLATSATAEVLAFAADELGLKTVRAHAAESNLASNKVLSTLGFLQTDRISDLVELHGVKITLLMYEKDLSRL